MPFFLLGFRFGNIGRDRSAEIDNSIESFRSVSPETRVDTSDFIVRHGHDTLSIATVDICVEKVHFRVDIVGSCLICEPLQVLTELRRSVTAISAPMIPKPLEYERNGHETLLEPTRHLLAGDRYAVELVYPKYNVVKPAVPCGAERFGRLAFMLVLGMQILLQKRCRPSLVPLSTGNAEI